MIFLVNNRVQRLGAHRFLAPFGGDQMHAVRPLDRPQQIDTAEKIPPAFAGGLDEMRAVQPSRLLERGGVTTQGAAVDFETEQLQPVLEAGQREVTAVPWEITGAIDPVFQAPQRERIEADDD